MTEPAAPDPRPPVPEAPAVAKPLRTWWPMALWTAGILLVLGLAWLIGAVVVPVWQVRSVFKSNYVDDQNPMHDVLGDRYRIVGQLGNFEQAASRLEIYLNAPRVMAPEKKTAIRLLGCCGSPGVKVLVRAMDGPDKKNKLETIQSMIVAGPEAAEAVPRLTRALEDRDYDIRFLSMLALGSIGSRAEFAIPALKSLLEDKDERVRSDAAEALKRIQAEGPRSD